LRIGPIVVGSRRCRRLVIVLRSLGSYGRGADPPALRHSLIDWIWILSRCCLGFKVRPTSIPLPLLAINKIAVLAFGVYRFLIADSCRTFRIVAAAAYVVGHLDC